MSENPDGGQLGPINESAAHAIINAYYADAIKSGTEARYRAQSTQAAMTVVAAGSFAALILAAPADLPTAARISALGAVVSWLISSIFFAAAIGQSPKRGRVSESTPSDLAKEVLSRAAEDRDRVDNRRAFGGWFSALGLTLLVVALGVYAFPPDTRVQTVVTVAGGLPPEWTCARAGDAQLVGDLNTLGNGTYIELSVSSQCDDIETIIIDNGKVEGLRTLKP